MQDHDRDLQAAFDDQAPRFAQAAVHGNAERLARLVAFAGFPPGARVLDVGCGPGFVSAALLQAGCQVVGIDLSGEMIERARQRCAGFSTAARFEQRSVFDAVLADPFDATISRFVLHHVTDPAAFVRRQAELLRPGGVLVLADHTTDPDPARADWHREVELGRDRTHTRNLTPGGLLDLLTAAGLSDLRLQEEPLPLDFDDWYDRGSPQVDKAELRLRVQSGPGARGFEVVGKVGNAVQLLCRLALVRGEKIG